jgi:hypothetical protein
MRRCRIVVIICVVAAAVAASAYWRLRTRPADERAGHSTMGVDNVPTEPRHPVPEIDLSEPLAAGDIDRAD